MVAVEEASGEGLVLFGKDGAQVQTEGVPLDVADHGQGKETQSRGEAGHLHPRGTDLEGERGDLRLRHGAATAARHRRDETGFEGRRRP